MPNLADKKWLAFLKRTRKCELSFSERVVFSYLVYQYRYGCGSSIGAISRFTGICRDVIPGHLVRLRACGLARVEGGEHFAVPPKGETAAWFPPRKGGGIGYYPVYMVSASCPLTDRQNALYWCLRDLDLDRDGEVKGQTESGLATLLSVSRQTIGTALRVLREHDLIEIGRGKRTIAFRLARFPLSWLRDAKEHLPFADEEEYVWETRVDARVKNDRPILHSSPQQPYIKNFTSSDDFCHLTFEDREFESEELVDEVSGRRASCAGLLGG